MELRDFFAEDAIKLELDGTTKDEILKALIGLLGLDDQSEGMSFKMLQRRENRAPPGRGPAPDRYWWSRARAGIRDRTC